MESLSHVFSATTLRTCSRCGQEFRTFGRAHICPVCKQPKPREPRSPNGTLSVREKQIVSLVREAKSNKEIGNDLHLAEGTIKEYLYTIFRKVGVRNRTELALWCMSHQESAA